MKMNVFITFQKWPKILLLNDLPEPYTDIVIFIDGYNIEAHRESRPGKNLEFDVSQYDQLHIPFIPYEHTEIKQPVMGHSWLNR